MLEILIAQRSEPDTSEAPIWVQEVLYNSDELAVLLATTASTSACPLCQLDSARIHSRYRRTLFDLPFADRPVRLQLQVRRFFCPTSDCPRCIFAERVPALTRPYAHRTSRMATALRSIGLALGGEAGARLARDLHLTGSPDTLLRLVRQPEGQTASASASKQENGPTIRVLGVDDWAKHKGRTYGTILCNLETGAVVDLLPDREAATFAAWLQDHPGIEIISRDRGGAYAEGARIGAPGARQVADRFHVLKNLGDALEELLTRLYQELSESYECIADGQPDHKADGQGDDRQVDEHGAQLKREPDTTTLTTRPTQVETHSALFGLERTGPRRRQRDIDRSKARRSARLARYEELARLHALGWSNRAIASHLDLDRKTVGRWLNKGSFPEYKYPQIRRSKLDEYKAYLHQRWEQGCHNAKRLWKELQQQGYRGGHTVVRDYVATLRQLQLEQEQDDPGDGRSGGSSRSKSRRLPSPRQLRWLLFKPVGQLNNEQYEMVLRLCRQSKEVTWAYGLVMDFQDLVRRRKAEHLASWVELALESGVAEMASFARGVQRDFAAVYAGMELEWSQGPVEGHVNRLKMIKRTMFGRANFDLLRTRVLSGY